MRAKRLSRRAFVLAGLAVSGAVLVAGGWAVGAPSRLAMRAARTIVRVRLSYLRLEPAGLTRFANDIVARYSPERLFRLVCLGAIVPVYARVFAPGNLETDLVSSFLMGSDFFRRARRPNGEVGYVGFYDPYTMICGNPFARFDERVPTVVRSHTAPPARNLSLGSASHRT